MGSYALLQIYQRYLVERSRFVKTWPEPWLLWKPVVPREGFILATGVTSDSKQAEGVEPVALEVVKKPASNPFAFGITVGHAENNDIVLPDRSVSRFHAWFQPTEEGLALADAESRNGTFVNGERLDPKVPLLLPDHAQLVFGEIPMEFHYPESFAAFLESLMDREG